MLRDGSRDSALVATATSRGRFPISVGAALPRSSEDPPIGYKDVFFPIPDHDALFAVPAHYMTVHHYQPPARFREAVA
jgi:hypothetical protein